VGYRGYFDRAEADAFAGELRAQGWEASVYGVPAYSTLGKLPGDFFADPLLSTFIRYPEGELARLIFHELTHQVAYASGDTVFNESFATTVERIGGMRWLNERADATARADYERFDARRRDFRALTMKYRDRLDALYKGPLPDDQKRSAKAALMAQLRADYAALKADAWGGFSGYDAWFEHANNASLGVLTAYNELVPDFERLYEREGRDFTRFYAEVKRLAALPKDERRAALTSSGD
jgi:predicted aminopeptidase